MVNITLYVLAGFLGASFSFVRSRPHAAASAKGLTFYDADGWIRRAPVSTGTTGRETPAGVFAVIEKDKDHHSTLYDDAWMPNMQRITFHFGTGIVALINAFIGAVILLLILRLVGGGWGYRRRWGRRSP